MDFHPLQDIFHQSNRREKWEYIELSTSGMINAVRKGKREEFVQSMLEMLCLVFGNSIAPILHLENPSTF